MLNFIPKTNLTKSIFKHLKCNNKVTLNKNKILDAFHQAFFMVLFHIFSCFCLTNSYIYAQNEADKWYFGFHSGLNFATTPPTALTNGQLSTNEGCATMSNANGELLFYTDGVQIWNNQHQVMPNATDLAGNYSATQSAIIVPQPQQQDIYYIFTVDDIAHDNGLQYSVVDMTLDDGKGNVSAKNIPLLSPTSEKITAVSHSNKNDVWIIAHEWNTNAFFAYLLTENGLNDMPVISYVGSIHQGNDGGDARGYLKATTDGTKLALALQSSAIFEIFDFDANIGTVTNAKTIEGTAFDWSETYGVEFSPDGTKFYGTAEKDGMLNIYQFDLNAVNMEESGLVVGESASDIRGALQLAPNGKIYLARYGSNYLGVINNPNMQGIDAAYIDDGIFLGNTAKSAYGLPSFVQSYFNNFHLTYQGTCLGDSTYFSLNTPIQIDSIVWQINNNFIYNELNTKYLFQNANDYLIQATIFCDDEAYEISQNITIENYPEIDINEEQILACENEILLLALHLENVTYEWPDGSTENTFCVTTAGNYDVTISNSQMCSTIASFNVLANYESNTDLIIESEMQYICFGSHSDISNTTLDNLNNNTYILHNHPNNDNFVIYAANETASFSISDNSSLNSTDTYYISALQNNMSNIFSNEQIAYECLQTQHTIPIQFLASASLSLEAYAIGVENCETVFQIYGQIQGNTDAYVLILDNDAIDILNNNFTFSGAYSKEALEEMLVFDENNCFVSEMDIQIYDDNFCFWDVQMPSELLLTCGEISVNAECLHAPKITYILHTNNENIMDNILAINDLGNFNIYEAVGFENDTLYISAVVGEDTGGLLPDVNFCNWTNDMAFISETATPVIFVLEENSENCNFETVTPINLLYFEGKTQQNGNLLSWATAAEKNNAFFSLEISNDGFIFREIARLQGKENSTTTQYYSFLDKNNTANKLYYRLSQTDFDGTTTSSKTIFIHRLESKSELHVYPLPAQNEIFIHLENNKTESQTYHFRMFDNIGNCLQTYTKNTDFATHLHLDISHLKSGFYFVEISNETEKWQQKIVKL